MHADLVESIDDLRGGEGEGRGDAQDAVELRQSRPGHAVQGLDLDAHTAQVVGDGLEQLGGVHLGVTVLAEGDLADLSGTGDCACVYAYVRVCVSGGVGDFNESEK